VDHRCRSAKSGCVVNRPTGSEQTVTGTAVDTPSDDLDVLLGRATDDQALPEETPSRPMAFLSVLSRGEGGWWTFAVFVLICAIFGIATNDFFSRANWVATSEYAVEYLLLALGQTFVIATAGIDLSDGAILGFSAMLAAVVMRSLIHSHMDSLLVTIIGCVVAVAVGTATGAINGVIITKAKLTPFIVTLGMLGMATGATYLLDNGSQVSTLPSQIGTLGATIWFGNGWLPAIVVVAAVFTAICWLLLSRTRFGLHTYVIGSNSVAGQRAGVRVERHLIKVYALSGFLAGVAGIMVTAKFSIATPIAGANDELDAIAAVVIGGASLFGGSGTIFGTLVGTFIISILVTGLVLLNVQPFWQQVAVGAVLIVAVFLDQTRRRLANA
jgi:ribose transport system permease protein